MKSKGTQFQMTPLTGVNVSTLVFKFTQKFIAFLRDMKRENQQDATIKCLLLTCLNMFRASLCPSSGEQRPCYCIWCVVLVMLDVVGSGCGALSCRMFSNCRILLVFLSSYFAHDARS